MKIQFIPTEGNDKAVDMIVDGLLIQSDIPYIPHLATDHRGTALYYFLMDVQDQRIDITEDSPNVQEIWRAYDYMSNPWHVLESINERLSKTESKKYKKY